MAIEIAERDGRVMVPAHDDYLILAGANTRGLELVEEVPDLDCLLAPCSGGGLFAGVSTAAKAMNPQIRCFCGGTRYGRRHTSIVSEGRTRYDSTAADDC
mgnify:CR=1 FL=1